MNHSPKVVVMGGGTGIFPVITALKHLNVQLSTVIAVSDSGSSTGRIRDEFGFQPVGDLRQSLAALAESEGEEWIRKILLYRFSKGDGLKGHNLGNLILTALQDMTGDTTEALEIAEKVFRLNGTVIPVTGDNINLQINYEDGTSEVGEHVLDHKPEKPKKIKDIALTPEAHLHPLAKAALLEADLIIIGPGDYYASLMAVLMVKGIPETLAQAKAKIVYIMNIMTRATQTKDMTAEQHAQGIEAAIGKKLDYILTNSQPVPQETLAIYAHEGEFPVVDDLATQHHVIREHLISDELAQKQTYDAAHRSLLRHDSQKLQKVLQSLLPAMPDVSQIRSKLMATL